MTERPTKRRGPLTWIGARLKREALSRLVWVEMGLAVLYLASYLPARLTFQWMVDNGWIQESERPIFDLVYSPMMWAAVLFKHLDRIVGIVKTWCFDFFS